MADGIDPTLFQGTLDLVILKTLTWGPKHGYAIARWAKTNSGDVVQVEDRALYLALHRLEERELIESEWGLSENNRRARYYRITNAGRRTLRAKRSSWLRYVDAISKILAAEEGATA